MKNKLLLPIIILILIVVGAVAYFFSKPQVESSDIEKFRTTISADQPLELTE